jgi:hypothetical protein
MTVLRLANGQMVGAPDALRHAGNTFRLLVAPYEAEGLRVGDTAEIAEVGRTWSGSVEGIAAIDARRIELRLRGAWRPASPL